MLALDMVIFLKLPYHGYLTYSRKLKLSTKMRKMVSTTTSGERVLGSLVKRAIG